MKNVKFMDFSAGHSSSILQDTESYLRTEADFVEDEIRLVLDEYNSSFIFYSILPGIYTFKDLSKFALRKRQSEFQGVNNTVDIDFVDISMKTKLGVKPGIIAIRLDGKSFLVVS